MPHVALQGPVNPEDIWLAFEPTEFKEKGNLYKAEAAYLDTEKSELLIRSLCVERGFQRRFMVRITARDGGVYIGLDGLGTPDRGDGVKRQIGLYTWKIMQAEPEAVVTATNISDFLGEPAP